jgi:hypothetical protein
MDHIITFEADTCVTLKKVGKKYVIDEDPNDGNESFYFAEIVKKSGAKYKVLAAEGPGGGWPLIEYSGTKKQLLPIIACLDAFGRDETELAEVLKYWEGDYDELVEAIW